MSTMRRAGCASERVLNNETHSCSQSNNRKTSRVHYSHYMAFIDSEQGFFNRHRSNVESAEIIILCDQSEKLPTRKGVRHGDTTSPKLFTEKVFRELDWEDATLRIKGVYFQVLHFADDIFLLTESAEQQQKCLKNYNQKASMWGHKEI